MRYIGYIGATNFGKWEDVGKVNSTFERINF
jgi:hypothetical protein